MQDMDYSKYSLGNGTEIYVYQSQLYTQTKVKLRFYSANGENNAAKTLVSMILMEGSRHFPTSQAISLAAENEFGADIGGSSAMNGGLHIASFGINALTKDTLTQGQNTFENMVALLADVVKEPLLEGGLFNNEYFLKKQEELLLGVKQANMDKDTLAERRFLEIALGKNAHTMPATGDEDEITRTTNADTVAAYSRMITSPRKIIVGTSLSPEYIAEILANAFKDLPSGNGTAAFAAPPEKNLNAKLEEKSEFDQSVVYVGLPFSISSDEKERRALSMLSFYIGGYSGGRLFTEIRTKRDMAYGAYSHIDLETGLIYGIAGIDIKNKDKTIEIMVDEFRKAASGKITKSGIAAAKRYVLSQIDMSMHAKEGRLQFIENSVLANRLDDIARYEQRYRNIGYEDVVKAASRITTAPIIYCLHQGDKQ